MISQVSEIVSAARRGEAFIMIDDERGKNEGHLVIAAEFSDSSSGNFMAKHARGLITLAIAGEHPSHDHGSFTP